MQEAGFAEAARVLRTGGTLALLWTGPDRSVEWVSRLMAGGRAMSPSSGIALIRTDIVATAQRCPKEHPSATLRHACFVAHGR